MRVRRNFGQRTRVLDTDEAVRKYFLVFEGAETEVQYFTGVNHYRASIGIHPLVELRPLLRSYTERGWSNPKKILNRLMEYVDESRTGKMSVDSLAAKVVDCLLEDGVISGKCVYQADDIYEILLTYFAETFGLGPCDCITDQEWAAAEVANCLEAEIGMTRAARRNLSQYLKNQNITYEEGFDKICLIVDRDKESFVSRPENDQFEYVYETCLARGYGFYLTNPCFEFWLLMHFDSVRELNPQLLRDNPKSAKRSYTETELKKRLPGYRKNSIRFEMLKDKIDTAIRNETYFCEEVRGLKDRIGSNIGLLMAELKGKFH